MKTLVKSLLFLSFVLAAFVVNPILAVALVLISAVPMQSGIAFTSFSPLVATPNNKFYETLFYEIIHIAPTLKNKLVNIIDGVKHNVTITDISSVVTLAPYQATGQPTAVGGDGIVVSDLKIIPYKFQHYTEFDMNMLRGTRFDEKMLGGAINILSNEFVQSAMTVFAPRIADACETLFWNGSKAATATAVAALTPGAHVTARGQAYVAASPVSYIDGIVTKLLYNYFTNTSGAVGTCRIVAGTTLSSSNIFDELTKVYAAIPSKTFVNRYGVKPMIYVPYSVQQMIDVYNTSQTYRSKFVVTGDKYYLNQCEIVFVGLADNTCVASIPNELQWLLDSENDENAIKIDKFVDPRDDYFEKCVFTQECAFINEADKVLYI